MRVARMVAARRSGRAMAGRVAGSRAASTRASACSRRGWPCEARGACARRDEDNYLRVINSCAWHELSTLREKSSRPWAGIGSTLCQQWPLMWTGPLGASSERSWKKSTPYECFSSARKITSKIFCQAPVQVRLKGPHGLEREVRTASRRSRRAPAAYQVSRLTQWGALGVKRAYQVRGLTQWGLARWGEGGRPGKFPAGLPRERRRQICPGRPGPASQVVFDLDVDVDLDLAFDFDSAFDLRQRTGATQRSRPLMGSASLDVMCGGVLLSREASLAVPSALRGLTSGFGMGPGVSPSLWPPQLYGITSLMVPGRIPGTA